jgi:CRP-like cAMP-binding protein
MYVKNAGHNNQIVKGKIMSDLEKNIQDFLREHPLLVGLTNDLAESIINQSSFCNVKAGTIVFNKGDEPQNLFVILSGRIGILPEVEGLHKIYLEELESPDVFGDFEILTASTVYQFSSCAIMDSTLVKVPINSILPELNNQSATFARNFSVSLCQRMVKQSQLLRGTVNQIIEHEVARGLTKWKNWHQSSDLETTNDNLSPSLLNYSSGIPVERILLVFKKWESEGILKTLESQLGSRSDQYSYSINVRQVVSLASLNPKTSVGFRL